jgi:hypothetical protein
MIDELKLQANLERIYNDPNYSQLEKQISQNNARFEDLSPSLKLLSVYLFSSGQEFNTQDFWRLFYKFKPPTIEEFLTDKYLPDTNQILYPQWRANLTKLFDPRKRYYELILGGSIGAGKTTACIVAHEYNLIKMCSLINPHATLGAAPNKSLVLSLFTVTLPKAKKALVMPFANSLKECKAIFEQVDDRKEWKMGFPSYKGTTKVPFFHDDSAGEIFFPNDISVMLGSQTSHALSFDMFGAFLDEAEFRSTDINKAFETYSALKERVRSRFLGSRFTLVTLVSSARYSTGVISEYTSNLSQDDPNTMYLAYPIWEIKTFDAYKNGHFYILRGNSNNPSKILNHEYDLIEKDIYTAPEGCEVVKVPESYRKDFELRIEEAIRNLAGMQTLGADHPFSQTAQIVDQNLIPEVFITAPLGEGIPLVNKLPSSLFKMENGIKRLSRYPNAVRYLHVDLAETNVAAITLLHKEIEGEKTVYVVDFVLGITSPTRIDVNAVMDLPIHLNRTYGVTFGTISSDQYQSTFGLQLWETTKIATEVRRLSVDRTLWPIGETARVVASSNLKVGECPNLRKQMSEVTIRSKAPMIVRGPSGKDQLDSLIGAITNAVEDMENKPNASHVYSSSGLQGVFAAKSAKLLQDFDDIN